MERADWPTLDSTLDNTERERSARFHFAADRCAFVAAHGLLRHLLAALHGNDIAACQWRFTAGPFGKPTIAEPSDARAIAFSLTHTRGRVAVAACTGSPDTSLGIDLEAIDHRAVDMELAEAFFAPAELRQLRAIADRSLRRDRFIALWTLKESFIKATGLGLSQPLADFAFDFEPIRVCLRDPEPVGGHWHFRQWRPDGRHLMALATHWPRGDPPVVRHWSFRNGRVMRD